MLVERHLRWIKRQDPRHADEDSINSARVPVVGPLFDIHHGRVVLGHVALAHAPYTLRPWQLRLVHRLQTLRQRPQFRGRPTWLRRFFRGKCWFRINCRVERAQRGRHRQRSSSGLKKGAAIQHCFSPGFSVRSKSSRPRRNQANRFPIKNAAEFRKASSGIATEGLQGSKAKTQMTEGREPPPFLPIVASISTHCATSSNEITITNPSK